MNKLRSVQMIVDLNAFGGAEATLLRHVRASAIPLPSHEVRALALEIISAGGHVPILLATTLGWLCGGKPKVMQHIRSLPFQQPLHKPARHVVQKTLALLSHFTSPVLVSNSTASGAAHSAQLTY